MIPPIKSQRFYLSHPTFEKKEVSRDEYIKAERAAGLFPKSGNPNDLATGGFGYGDVSGTVETEYDFSARNDKRGL